MLVLAILLTYFFPKTTIQELIVFYFLLRLKQFAFEIVIIDGKKKASLQVSKTSKEEATTEEEENETSEEDDPDYVEGDESSDSEQDGRSDSEEDISENEDDDQVMKKTKESPATAMVKTSAKQVKKDKKQAEVSGKKRKKANAEKASNEQVKRKKLSEKSAEAEAESGPVLEKEEKSYSMETGDDSQNVKGKGARKEMPAFSDKNVDYDLFHNSATNVIPRRIKISNNLVITSRMVEQTESKNITNDYPAITFQRKTTGEKCFEFILPLNLVPKIMEAMNLIVKDNSKFFANVNPQ